MGLSLGRFHVRHLKPNLHFELLRILSCISGRSFKVLVSVPAWLLTLDESVEVCQSVHIASLARKFPNNVGNLAQLIVLLKLSPLLCMLLKDY